MMGKHGVNIAGMSLSRNEAGGQALTVPRSGPKPSVLT
jgi:hypothetical protein